MRYSLCIDMIYVSRGANGWIWATNEQLLQGMRLAKQLGLPGVEFWAWEGRDLDALQELQNELDLEVTAICMKYGDRLGIADADDDLERGFLESARIAKRFCCRNLILNANLCPRDLPRGEVLHEMARQLRFLAPLAEREEITLLLEPLSEGFFQSSSEAFSVIEQVDSRAVRLLYDIYHFQIIEGNILNTIRKYLPLIGHIHGAGVPARESLHDSEVDYRFLLQQLQQLGYDGWFCLEFFTFDHREAQLRKTCELLV